MSEVAEYGNRKVTYTIVSTDCRRHTSYDNLADATKRMKNLLKRGMVFDAINYYPHINEWSIFFTHEKENIPQRSGCGRMEIRGRKLLLFHPQNDWLNAGVRELTEAEMDSYKRSVGVA